jgi:hypothetical protein
MEINNECLYKINNDSSQEINNECLHEINNDNEEYINVEKNDDEEEKNDDEEEKIDMELYNLIFSKIKQDDNFDEYTINDISKSPSKNNKSPSKNTDNKILFSKDMQINKRTFKPRLPPYNQRINIK